MTVKSGKAKTKEHKKWDFEEKVWRSVPGVESYIEGPQTGKFTDASSYGKKSKKSNISGKPKFKAEGGRIGFAHGSKRPKGGWTA